MEVRNGLRFRSLTIFHQGALGDFLVACPVFEALSNLVDSKRIIFWTRLYHAELIEDEPFFGGFFPSDDISILPFFDDELWKSAPLPSPCRESDMVILFGGQSLREVSERLNYRLAELGGKCLWCLSFPGEDGTKPVPLFIADSLGKSLSFEISIRPFRLAVSRSRMEDAGKLMNGLNSPIFIHPGSGGIRKVWPLSRWMGLIKWLKDSFPNISIVIITGPADDFVEPMVEWALERYGIKRFHNISLPLLSAMFSLGSLYIGNDSGVSHLAASSGLPVVVIFGPTNPSVWAPWSDRVRVIRQNWKKEEILSMPDDCSIKYVPDIEIKNAVLDILLKGL